ncbi:MAG: PEP-CTERM sorting domain-containing protein [Opitutales bacterium]|nr:PEP-CTERM sorting domain-containing protein [Opitutales bacterium]
MKSIITTALLCAAAVSANAAWSTNLWEQSTDTVKYTYTQDSQVQLVPNNGGLIFHETDGSSREVQVHTDPKVIVDFTKDARYELSYRIRVIGSTNNGSFPYCNLSLVTDKNDASILFGNSNNTPCQIGIIPQRDVTTSSQMESLTAVSSGTLVYSTNWKSGALSEGFYTYKIIFETFADNSINDKIYFGVSKDGGETAYQTIVNSSHLGLGGHTSKVFDDIGFHLNGADFTSDTITTEGFGGIKLFSTGSTYTVYSRTAEEIKQPEPNVPEPSAFGLLAGLGAIALAVSRRRRSR